MNLSEYKLLASAGVASINMGFLGLWAGDPVLGATVFGVGALFTLAAATGALWFSGPWKKPVQCERVQSWRPGRND